MRLAIGVEGFRDALQAFTPYQGTWLGYMCLDVIAASPPPLRNKRARLHIKHCSAVQVPRCAALRRRRKKREK